MLRLRLLALLHSRRVDRDLNDELEAHLAYLTEEHVAAGLDRRAAREQALREFGGVVRLTEECREARGLSGLTNAVQDFKYGVRLLRRTPGFTAATVLTLALGVGATTAMFSIVYGVVLRPLPFGEAHRLVALWTAAPSIGLPRALVGAANARDWRAETTVFEDVALVRAIGNFNLVGQGEPERLQGALISSNLLSVLRVAPLIGRAFTDDEDEIGNDKVVILSYALWNTRFAADTSVIGRTILLNGAPTTIVGVMGPDFQYPSREFQIWRPLTINPNDYKTRTNFAFLGVARLKPGASLEQARTEMDVISARLEKQYPANKGIAAVVEPLLDGTVAAVRRPLFVLLAAVAAMLLIGCANLANLLLTRALARRRELAVRTAMGAARARLIAQSITELAPTLLLGGVLGLLLARWILQSLVPLMPADMPRVESIGLHLPVLLVSLGVLAAIGVFVGMWPALVIARSGQTTPLAELTRATTAAPGRMRARDLLVVTQVAMTLLLLVTATLLIRSFTTLKEIDPGFTSERVLSLHLAIPRSKYGSDTAVADFCRRILDRVTSLPEVESAGMVNRLPLAGGVSTGGIQFDGADPSVASVPSADLRSATPGYFRTMGIPLKDGRTFSDADTETAPLVGIIDERLARAVWPNANPIGRRFRGALQGEPWITIVGVAGHIRHDSLEADSRPQVYWNYLQRAMDRMALVVKTRGEPEALTRSIAGVIRSIDPEQPIYDVRTLEAVVDRSLARRWLQTTLLAVFAALALLLATIGVYGVISYAVGQRTREFGIRLALGARRADVVAMVVGRGARVTLAGLALGAVAAAGVSRAIGSMLFGITPFDAISFAASVGVLTLVALSACYVPARRAGSIDPTLALRSE